MWCRTQRRNAPHASLASGGNTAQPITSELKNRVEYVSTNRATFSMSHVPSRLRGTYGRPMSPVTTSLGSAFLMATAASELSLKAAPDASILPLTVPFTTTYNARCTMSQTKVIHSLNGGHLSTKGSPRESP